MNPDTPRALEAILLVADAPLETELLAGLVELPPARAEEVLAGLATGYAEQGRGFQLVRVAGGWRFQTAPDMAPYVERYVLEGQTAKLSAAALETLAIIAYKQPISRAQIAAIRGVSVDGVVRTLEQRGYIGEVARDPGPGQAVLFGTTPSFLEKMGLDSLSQLPAIADFVPGADVVEALEHGLRVEGGAEEPSTGTPLPTAVPEAVVLDDDLPPLSTPAPAPSYAPVAPDAPDTGDTGDTGDAPELPATPPAPPAALVAPVGGAEPASDDVVDPAGPVDHAPDDATGPVDHAGPDDDR